MRAGRSRWSVLAGLSLALAGLVPVGGSAVAAEVQPAGVVAPLPASSYSISDIQAYITEVYRDLFDRAPDPVGLAAWTDALFSGVPYGAVANAITGSTEYRSGLITAAYLDYLGRPPEPAGLQAWLGQMAIGSHIEQVQAGFIASEEFYSRSGGADRGWVTLLYRTVLGRDPASSEVSSWVAAMAGGTSRSSVALGFLYSTEHLTTVVDGYYLDLLGRHIDPSGQTTWVGLIQTGHRDEEIIAGIVSSTEYRSTIGVYDGPFVRDTVRVGQISSAWGTELSMSSEGRWLAFDTASSNLVAGDTDGVSDVFLWDRTTRAMVLISAGVDGLPANEASWTASISGDGRWVAYASLASNLVDGDTNTASDVFVWDRTTGQTSFVSRGKDGSPANDRSYEPSISADGRWVAYSSFASNLADVPWNGSRAIYLTDRTTGATTLVSVDADGAPANGNSKSPSISADGRWVTYESLASNLSDGDGAGTTDVFVWDRETGQTTRVSATSAGSVFDGFFVPSISADGSWVTYTAGVVGNPFGNTDNFLWDRLSGQTSRLFAALDREPLVAASQRSTISANGRWVVCSASLQEPGWTGLSHVYVTDRVTGITALVSVGLLGRGGGVDADSFSQKPVISADGGWIVYYSNATDLVEGDTNGAEDVFVSRNPLGP